MAERPPHPSYTKMFPSSRPTGALVGNIEASVTVKLYHAPLGIVDPSTFFFIIYFCSRIAAFLSIFRLGTSTTK